MNGRGGAGDYSNYSNREVMVLEGLSESDKFILPFG